MRWGYFGIGSGPCADPQFAAKVAARAEQAGLSSLWTGEHVVLPDPRVPPSPVRPDHPMVDPIPALAFVAGITSRVRLGTGIIIVPQRNPVVLAKQMASVDVLSGGRLDFGIGIGYLKPEFEAIGVPFDAKGPRTDDAIDAMRALWTLEKPEFHGRYTSFAGVNAYPRPVQAGGPPIIVGGHSEGAFRRAIERGNGWYGFALDVEGAKRCVDGLKAASKKYERPAHLGELSISVTPRANLDKATADAFEEIGVGQLIVNPIAGGPDGVLSTIDAVAGLL